MNRRAMMLSVFAVAVVTFAASAWFTTRPASVVVTATVPPEQSEALLRPCSPILGPKEASGSVVEFFDPACKACCGLYPVVKYIMAEHRDAVRVAIRYTPFHGEVSEEAIRVLEADRMQDVFEPVMEALLREQPRWASHGTPAPGLMRENAAAAGLDVEAARTQTLFPGTMGVINQDRADVETMGVRQTPASFVNGGSLDPFGEAEMRALVAEEVAASYS
ncbi:disulfide bond formation protein DsbA [Cereibacter changlensis]|uniref:Disulfide bond formation protein DsbA n=1 Tax=Cereibacter changlensis TaxID=402884 RepID=A0A4U0Z724_9RHOB|nr:thioredoxin domain-containing protein [Cereibacter changlensis]TKA98411.1 disulfide bond formation protein DsbA [Cereibacter changlensis]